MKRTPRQFAHALVDLLLAAKDASQEKAVMRDFLSFLLKKRMMKLLPRIVMAFETLWRERTSQHVVHIETAKKMSDDRLRSMTTHFREALGGSVSVTPILSKTLVAGLKVRVGDAVLDGSMQTRLSRLHQHLLS